MNDSQYIAKCLRITARIVMLIDILACAVVGCILFRKISEPLTFLGILVGGAVGSLVGWFIFVIFMAIAQIVLNTERSAVACENIHQADNNGGSSLRTNNNNSSVVDSSVPPIGNNVQNSVSTVQMTKESTSTPSPQSELTQGEFWICPDCGKKNKKFHLICKRCYYSRKL